MNHILAVFYDDWLPWIILGGAPIAGIAVIFLARSPSTSCKRCRPRARARGKCTCLTDCGHRDCTGDRPTIRAAWTASELAVLRGEKELEDL